MELTATLLLSYAGSQVGDVSINAARLPAFEFRMINPWFRAGTVVFEEWNSS